MGNIKYLLVCFFLLGIETSIWADPGVFGNHYTEFNRSLPVSRNWHRSSRINPGQFFMGRTSREHPKVHLTSKVCGLSHWIAPFHLNLSVPILDGDGYQARYPRYFNFSEVERLQNDALTSNAIVLNLGLELEPAQFALGGLYANDTLLLPRIGLNYPITDQMRFHVFYGKVAQPAQVEALRYQYLPFSRGFAALDSYEVDEDKDDYFEAGIHQVLTEDHLLVLNAYYKNGTHIVDDFHSVYPDNTQPFGFATGVAYGFEVSLKGQLSEDWSEFFTYSYGFSIGQGSADEDSPGPMMDDLRVHTAKAGIAYSKNQIWWIAQVLHGSGMRSDGTDEAHLPAHLTVDTTLGYEFAGNDWWSGIKVSGDILNVLDTRYGMTVANGFNDSSYASGRQFLLRLSKEI